MTSATISQFYAVEVSVVGILLMYVMQASAVDPLYENDDAWIKRLTRISFIVGAFLCGASYFTDPSPGMAVLLGAAIFILGVNAYKLHRRSTPAGPLGQQIKAKARIY
jgi:hypothetical protein